MRNQVTKGLVSVLIPVFNRVNYIGETLQSVFNQTYKNVEIIVVDDGSTDGCFELLTTEHNAKKITLLTHENRANKGQSCALNLALSYAKGEFISILDSDDLFEPEKLQIQVEFMRTNRNIGLVYGNGTAIDANGQKLYDINSKFKTEPNDPNEVLLDCYFLLPQNSLIRHKCFVEAGGFNEDYRAAQDHDMLIRICEVTDISYIKQKFFKYRQHEDSISSKGLYKRWSTGFDILKAAKARFNYKPATIRKRKAVLHFRMFQVYFSHGPERNRVKGFFHLIYAGILDPFRASDVLLRRKF